MYLKLTCCDFEQVAVKRSRAMSNGGEMQLAKNAVLPRCCDVSSRPPNLQYPAQNIPLSEIMHGKVLEGFNPIICPI